MGRKPANNRHKTRFLAEDAEISVTLTPLGTNKEIWGIVIDFSEDGFQINVPLEIKSETLLKITICRKSDCEEVDIEHLSGRVVWCRPDTIVEDCYNLGIELSELNLLS